MSTDAQALLVLDSVSKHYGAVHALQNVTVDVARGEVLALMGENGAGKSTLLKILSGDVVPDTGRIRIAGQAVSFASTRDAHNAGVRVIAQEPEIIPDVSVAENIYVGALPKRGVLFNKRVAHGRAHEDLLRYGFAHALRPDALGSEMTAAQRQLVEIMRALIADVRVLAFDEPTSSLSDAEVDNLFDVIGRLRDSGIGIIYVSHRMPEVFRISSRVTVLRDGQVVGSRPTSATSEDELVTMMVGRSLAGIFERRAHDAGEVVLSVEDLTSDHVTGVDLQVRAGEVVGISGLMGAGRSELAHAIVGADPIRSGRIRVAGRLWGIRSPRDALRAGIGFAPEERKAQALLMHRSVRDNISLCVLDRITVGRVVRRTEERRIAGEFADRLRIRTPSIEQLVSALSGGNQQKVVLARWLARRPRVLILDEPTRGVDVGAKAEIYAAIDQLAADGLGIVVISSELPEVLALSDRIVVMRGGRVTGEVSRAHATEEALLSLAMKEHPESRESSDVENS